MFATVARMEGFCLLKKWGSRFSAAHIRFENVQQFQGWRAVRFQIVALAFTPRTLVLNICDGYTDGGRVVLNMGPSLETSSDFEAKSSKLCNSYADGGQPAFKMGLSPWRRAHSS